MIHIFFVPGMFGSMLENVLMTFTNLAGQPRHKSKICADGSMHSFRKQHHPSNLQSMDLHGKNPLVTTPIYPFPEAKLPEIIEKFSNLPSWNSDRRILVHAHNMEWAEINMLFQWYKISVGLKLGIEIFGIERADIKKWNSDYDHWTDMQAWQVREWLSIFYREWITEWIHSSNQVSDDWLVISNRDLLMDTKTTIQRILDFCDLTLTVPIDDFLQDYRRHQQYVLDEYATVIAIVDSVLQDRYHKWNALSIVGEALLQSHFRQRGYEWRCDGLDTLPTNSIELANIIYTSTEDLHA